jgi:hypothetical protein
MTTHNPETQDVKTQTPHQRAQLKAEVVRLKDSGKSFAEVGAQLGISKPFAHKVYWQAVAEVPQPAVNEMRAQQNERLEMVLRRLEDIADRDHVVISGGEIVRDKEGQPMRDSGPEMQALRDLRATVEAQAKLNGTNAPAQVTVNGQITYQVNGVDLGNLS